MINFQCAACGEAISVSEANIGHTGWCPKCDGKFTVPAQSQGSPAIPSPFAQAEPFKGPPPLPPHAMGAATPNFIDEEELPLTEAQPIGQRQIAQPVAATPPRPQPQAQGYIPPPPFANQPLPRQSNVVPVILSVFGALFIIATIVFVVVGGRRAAERPYSNQANDESGPRKKTPPPVGITPRVAPDPTHAFELPKVFVPDTTTQPTTRPRTGPGIRTTGAQQSVFDPAPKIANPTTRPVDVVKQIKTSPALVTPVQVEQAVYFAAKDGNVYGIDASSLEVSDQRKLGQMVTKLVREGTELKAESLPAKSVAIAEYADANEPLDPENVWPDGTPFRIDGKRTPLSWRQHTFAEKQVVQSGGKYYRPLTGGGIKILDAGEVKQFDTKLVGMGVWRIALLPNGPMGYDNTSVYELDQNLCPIRRIINLDGDVGRWSTGRIHAALASDGKTLCFVSIFDNKRRMMIWSLDGREKLREQKVNYIEQSATEGKRLFVMGDGYLFVGGELTWLPSGEGAPAQYMVGGLPSATPEPQAAQPSPGSSRRLGAVRTVPPVRKIQNFTPPVVVGNRVFVGYAGGDVYVFEQEAFARASGASNTRRATTNE